MKFRKSTATFAAITCAAVLAAVSAKAGGDKVAFPENYAKGVLYTTVDRADNKQYRELYVSPPEAVAAAKKGEPLPSGTVLTLVQFAAKLDAQGNPEKGPNGRFIKDKLLAYTVMEKRTGWGAEYPETMRNGEWEYQAFRADKSVNTAPSSRLLQLPQAARHQGRLRLQLRQAEIAAAPALRNENGPASGAILHSIAVSCISGSWSCGRPDHHRRRAAVAAVGAIAIAVAVRSR